MANGQFPVTYDVAAEATGYAHEDVNALIALEALKTSRGRKFMGMYNPGEGDVMIGGPLPGSDEETVRRIYDPKSAFWQKYFGKSLTDAIKFNPAHGKIAEVEPIHMPSYATLMEMALDYPWTGEGGEPSKEITDQLYQGYGGMQAMPDSYFKKTFQKLDLESQGMTVEQWEKEEAAKALEMLLSGSALTEKMRMGDVPGGSVSYHLPDLYKQAEAWRGYDWLGGVAHKGEKQLRPEEEHATMLWQGNMPHPLKPSFYEETPDTTKTFASAISAPRYAHQLNIETRPGEAPDTTYEKIGLFHPGSKWDKAYEDDYMKLLQSLLHEPFHLKTAQKDIRGYGFRHPQYSPRLFNDIEQLLTKSLLAKLSKKDLMDITKRLVAGEEIDFGKYKRLDIGGE
jgi:hypothetical protein